jgi:hypothetical protein
MTNRLIKVDRVRSVAEAVALERLGVSMIGVALAPDPRFADDRQVSVEQAAEIRAALTEAAFVALVDEPSFTGADHLQAMAGQFPADARAKLRAKGVGVVQAGIEIAHDDDPGWVFSAYDGDPPELFQVDVLPEYRDSWRFLRDRSPEYADEFQIADLDALTRERPMVLGFDFAPDNAGEIVAAFPAARGVFLTLGARPRRGDVRCFTYESASALIEHLR